MDLSLPSGFSKVSHFERDPQEFIKKWARYSRGLGEAPEYLEGGHSLRSLVDVIYESRFNSDTFFGLPHDTRRLLAGYIRLGDRVFVWGHPFSWITNLREVLDRATIANWLLGPGVDRVGWARTMDPLVGCYARVQTVDFTHALLDPGGARQAFNKANLALSVEDHQERLRSSSKLRERWDKATNELDLGRRFNFHADTGYLF